MDIQDILKNLPHRYPMLLVDRILEVTEDRVVGIKNVTINEPFFQGHYPGHPVMPGVLILEHMAQVGGILLLKKVPDAKGKVIYLMGFDKVRYRRPVVPGDQLRTELKLLKIRSRMAVMSAEAFVGDERACEAEIMATIVDAAAGKGAEVHPTAVVEEGAQLGTGTKIGAYAFVGAKVRMGEGSVVDHHAIVTGDTVLGARNHVFPYAVVGSQPQDVKYKEGQDSKLEVGDDNIFREFCTVNTSTVLGGCTRIGNRTWIMAYAHVAHDCVIGSDVKVANAVNMGGHVTIEDGVILGGLVAIHQFVKIGTLAMVGGASRVSMDVLPYVIAGGNPLRVSGINSVGLERKGASPDLIRTLKKAYHVVMGSKKTAKEAVEELRRSFSGSAEAVQMARFLESSERGVHR